MKGKITQLQRVAQQEAVDAVQPPSPVLGAGLGDLDPTRNAKGGVFEVDVLRGLVREGVEREVKAHYRVRYGVFAVLMYHFHKGRARLRKLAFGDQVTHDKHASHVKHQRDRGNGVAVPVEVIHQANEICKDGVGGAHAGDAACAAAALQLQPEVLP